MSNAAPSPFFAVFPGQGSQHVGMGKDLCENFKVAREVFEEASEASHANLRKLCFEGPEADLTATENTQPCLLAASVAAFRVAETELGFRPLACAGHSLGEYSALVAAGALPLGAAARWVRERGRAMQAAVPAGQGTMAAILGMDENSIAALCARATADAKLRRSSGENAELTVEAVVEPANFNAPGQIVIAGSTDAVGCAVALIKAGEFPGGKAIPLQVSAPFHCRLMAPARDCMAGLFEQATREERPKELLCPYIPNRTGRLSRETGLVFEFLVEQVDHPVLWKDSMVALLEAGHDCGIEFGPGKVLTGLGKRISQHVNKSCSMTQLADSAAVKSLGEMLKR